MRVVDVQVQYSDGNYTADGFEDFNGLRFSIVGEGATWEALKADVRQVVNAIYYDTPKPDRIMLHLVHDEDLVIV